MGSSLFDRHYHDSSNWRLGLIYFCRADRRLMVPKRIRGLGWTLNFARPLAVPFLGFLMAVIPGALELARSLGAGGDARLVLGLLLMLGLIALCHRLSVPKPDADSPSGKAG